MRYNDFEDGIGNETSVIYMIFDRQSNDKKEIKGESGRMFERKSYIVSQQFMKFFMPTVLMTMALSMSIVVDGMIVGNMLGPDALAAVNLVLPVTLIFNSLYVLFGVGGSALYSVAQGRREKERAKQLFTMSVGAMLAAAVVVLCIGLFVSGRIAAMLTANAPNLTHLVSDYLSFVMLAAPLLILVPGLVYFIRSSGKVQIASAVLIVANVVNLLLDLVYIGVFKIGIRGAALATGTGYFVGLLIALYGVYRAKELRPAAVPVRKIPGMVQEIASTGLPNAINTVLNLFRLTCINMLVMTYLGSDGVTAFSICTSCLSIVSMFVGGSAQTMGPLLGTLYGEGDANGVRFTVKKAVTITGISTLILLAIFELFLAQITGMFGVTDARQIAIATQALRIYAVSLPMMGILFVSLCVYPVLGYSSVEKRLKSLLFYYFENTYEELLGDRLFVVEGDVTDAKVFDRLVQDGLDVQTVINCAANVKHFSADTDIEDVNVGGVLHAIDFCEVPFENIK